VHQLDVVQRHFTGIEHAIDAFHLDRDLLATREQVVLVEGVDVLEVVLRLRARQEFHAAALQIGG
jgi:hypothetical protein